MANKTNRGKMGKKFNIIERILLNIIKYKISDLFSKERSLLLYENAIKPATNSPYKTWPDPEKIPLGGELPFSLRNIIAIGKYVRSCISQAKLSIESLKFNPSNPKPKISKEELSEFENYAKSLGVGAIGYTKLPRELIFQEKAVLYDNAIVLLMEMDKDKLSKAPSLETFKMVFQTYDRLGRITNKLASYLRENGYSAHPSPALGGYVLYPPLAQKAGLGWIGLHGLLITPQFGPRVRISAIFTNIENLPFSNQNTHSWIQEFCRRCRKCFRTCPAGAIYEKPIIHESGRETHIDASKCKPFFVTHYACSVCLKECVFNYNNYETIKNNFFA